MYIDRSKSCISSSVDMKDKICLLEPLLDCKVFWIRAEEEIHALRYEGRPAVGNKEPTAGEYRARFSVIPRSHLKIFLKRVQSTHQNTKSCQNGQRWPKVDKL